MKFLILIFALVACGKNETSGPEEEPSFLKTTEKKERGVVEIKKNIILVSEIEKPQKLRIHFSLKKRIPLKKVIQIESYYQNRLNMNPNTQYACTFYNEIVEFSDRRDVTRLPSFWNPVLKHPLNTLRVKDIKGYKMENLLSGEFEVMIPIDRSFYQFQLELPLRGEKMKYMVGTRRDKGCGRLLGNESSISFGDKPLRNKEVYHGDDYFYEIINVELM